MKYNNGTMFINQWGRTCKVINYDDTSGFYITKDITYDGRGKERYTREEDIEKNIIKEVF